MVISAIVSVMEISEPLGGNSLAFKYSAYLVLSLLFSYVIRLAFVCGADTASLTVSMYEISVSESNRLNLYSLFRNPYMLPELISGKATGITGTSSYQSSGERVKENAHVALDQDEYQKRYDALVARFDKAKARHTEVTDLITERMARKHQIEAYLKNLRSREPLTEFRETDWLAMVDYITVHSKKDIRVTFKDGTEIKA